MNFLNDVHSSWASKAASNPRGPFKRSLIHYAAMGGCSELLRFLLRNGAAKDDRDQNKRTPLSWAAEYGAFTSVKILLEHGAKINSTDDMYSTPLSWLIHASSSTAQMKQKHF
jgi:ankyrin repeat protein